MTEYFSIAQQSSSTFNIESPLSLTIHNAIIINNHIIYADLAENSLAVINLNERQQKQEMKSNYIKIGNYILNEGVTHLIQIHSVSNLANSPFEQQYYILFVTYSKICIISLDKTLTKLLQIHDCYHLILEPHLNIQQVANTQNRNLHNARKTYKLLNQQLLYLQQSRKLILAGYNKDYRIIVNSYLIEKSGRQFNKQSLLTLISQSHLEYHQNILKNIYNHSFTLSCPGPHEPTIYMYQVANQKGLPTKFYKYNLHDALFSQNTQIKIEKTIEEMYLVHSYLHIRAVYQQEDELFICYTKYVPFQKEKKKKNDCQNENKSKEQGLSYIWIYNLSIGYTKNIINIEGPIVSTSVFNPLKFPNSKVKDTVKFFTVVSIPSFIKSKEQRIEQNKDGWVVNYATKIVKMDSSKYHPHFQITTAGNPLVLNHSKYIITDLQKNTDTESLKILNVYEKINKNLIYSKIWQELGNIGGENMLYQVLDMLSMF